MPLVPSGTRLQLDGWLTHPRSVSGCEPGSGPCQRLCPGSAPIRPPVVNRQRRSVTSPQMAWRWCSARRSSVAPTFVSLCGFQAKSLHQTPIGDLVRSVLATPRPRNSSVPSLVQSKSSWLTVQLAPGSREGQNSLEERSSAPHEWWEGRWVPNQRLQMPGMFQEANA